MQTTSQQSIFVRLRHGVGRCLSRLVRLFLRWYWSEREQAWNLRYGKGEA